MSLICFGLSLSGGRYSKHAQHEVSVEATGQHILRISCPIIKDWWCILQLVLSNPEKLLNYKAQRVKRKLISWLHLVQLHYVSLPALVSNQLIFSLFNANFTHINWRHALPQRVDHSSSTRTRKIQNFLKHYPRPLSSSPWEDVPYSWVNSPHSMYATDKQVPKRRKGR